MTTTYHPHEQDGDYYCALCHQYFTVDITSDVHSTLDGEDCCETCCPECHPEKEITRRTAERMLDQARAILDKPGALDHLAKTLVDSMTLPGGRVVITEKGRREYMRTHPPTNTVTKQERDRIQNSADWMYLAGQRDADLLARNLMELWSISRGRARTHAAHAIGKARARAIAERDTYTPRQKSTVEANPHYRVVQRLDDDDLLILDLLPSATSHGHHLGPYILTTDGFVQDVNYHYKTRHGMADVPFEY